MSLVKLTFILYAFTIYGGPNLNAVHQLIFEIKPLTSAPTSILAVFLKSHYYEVASTIS